MVVVQRVRMLIESMDDRDLAPEDIDRKDLSLEEPNMSQHLPNGINDMGQTLVSLRPASCAQAF
jgi:hypothetical protein